MSQQPNHITFVPYRENLPVRPPSVARDVGWLVAQSTLGFLVLYILSVLVFLT